MVLSAFVILLSICVHVAEACIYGYASTYVHECKSTGELQNAFLALVHLLVTSNSCWLAVSKRNQAMHDAIDIAGLYHSDPGILSCKLDLDLSRCDLRVSLKPPLI